CPPRSAAADANTGLPRHTAFAVRRLAGITRAEIDVGRRLQAPLNSRVRSVDSSRGGTERRTPSTIDVGLSICIASSTFSSTSPCSSSTSTSEVPHPDGAGGAGSGDSGRNPILVAAASVPLPPPPPMAPLAPSHIMSSSQSSTKMPYANASGAKPNIGGSRSETKAS
ncbi:hypothetical protein Vafri_18757, partial [Volvox africanus]